MNEIWYSFNYNSLATMVFASARDGAIQRKNAW